MRDVEALGAHDDGARHQGRGGVRKKGEEEENYMTSKAEDNDHVFKREKGVKMVLWWWEKGKAHTHTRSKKQKQN